MSFDSWVKNSWLDRLKSDANEIARLLALADGRLADYEKAVAAKLSADVQLTLAYDAIRAWATAALRAAGYRVTRGGASDKRSLHVVTSIRAGDCGRRADVTAPRVRSARVRNSAHC